MSPAAKAREAVNGRTTTSARTSSRARLIDRRGGPRYGPPASSSEGGYAPLGLPRPALGRAPAEPWRASMTASPATPLLELENVEVVYHRVATAVQGVSLRVPERSIVALLGTNGAGKTTTLRAVSGFLGGDDARVVAGRIVFRGEVITGRMPHEVARRGLVLVPERDKVFETLTVGENLDAVVPGRRRLVTREQGFHY